MQYYSLCIFCKAVKTTSRADPHTLLSIINLPCWDKSKIFLWRTIMILKHFKKQTMNYLSVSPYTTWAPHFFVSFTSLMARSNVSLALWTMLSPICKIRLTIFILLLNQILALGKRSLTMLDLVMKITILKYFDGLNACNK